VHERVDVCFRAKRFACSPRVDAASLQGMAREARWLAGWLAGGLKCCEKLHSWCLLLEREDRVYTYV
jgi:hypothetical protein